MAVRVEQDVAGRAIERALADRWPWGRVEIDTLEPDDVAVDAVVVLPTTAGPLRVAMEVKRQLAPSAVPGVVAQLAQAVEVLDLQVGMVVAPWLSPQTRARLERDGVGYVDETGNMLVKVDDPPVYVRRDGADANPEPVTRKRRGLAGARAGEIVRTLLDVAPPYTLDEIVEAIPGGIDPGYTSRVLTGLAQDDLIQRQPRGPVTDVDIAGLLDAWRGAYDPFKVNSIYRYVDMMGPRAVATKLGEVGDSAGRWVATGSLVASALAPVTAPYLGMFYTENPGRLAEEAGLLEADDTANVILAVPYSPIVFARTWTDRRTNTECVAPAQAVVDLTGGRAEQEAEALIDWMANDIRAWRNDNLGSTESRLVERAG